MSAHPAVSVVVIAKNEGELLRSTVDSLLDTLPAAHEILVVDDGSEDGSADGIAAGRPTVRVARAGGLGVARARNWGARQTAGGVIVFADAHLELPRGWLEPLLEALENPAAGAVAPGIRDSAGNGAAGYGLFFTGPDLRAHWLPRRGDDPYPVPILPGCTLAMRREIFTATGGFDDGLRSRGGVDNEFGVRFWLQGLELRVVPRVTVRHVFRKVSPYAVSWDTFLHNYLRLALLHFGETRRARVFDALGKHGAFAEALAQAEQGIGVRRAELEATRRYDDDWFFQRFSMAW